MDEEYLPCENRTKDGYCKASTFKIRFGNLREPTYHICPYHNPKNCPIFNFHNIIKEKNLKDKLKDMEDDNEQ